MDRHYEYVSYQGGPQHAIDILLSFLSQKSLLHATISGSLPFMDSYRHVQPFGVVGTLPKS